LQNQVLEELVIGVVRLAFGLRFVFEHARKRNLVSLGHQLGDVAGVEEVVYADQELFLDDLSVGYDECHWFGWLDRTFFVEVADVFFEAVLVLVAFDRDLELDDFVQEDRQFGDRLLARASDSEEQRVAGRLLDDARDVADVLYGLTEEHEWHGGLLVVVLLQFVGEDIGQLRGLVPVLRSECEFTVANDLVNEGGEDIARHVSVLVGFALDFFLVEFFELSHFLQFLLVDLVVLWEETVFEHALGLVQPALSDLVGLSAVEIRFGHQQALDDA
jgi:hypothetical protein